MTSSSLDRPLRKIAFVTTARSDYNTMYPVMHAAQNDPEIECQIFCTGMHLVERFGQTWRQLESDGLDITSKVGFFSEEDSDSALAMALSKGVAEFTEALCAHKPDIIAVSGDRIENLSLFVAATALGIPIAHMCGGDITEGALDNQIRHTMTKLAHLHFVSMPEHARRVIQMGEEPWRLTLTGDAALDVIRTETRLDRKSLKADHNIPTTPFFLTTFHPQTLGRQDAVEQYKNVLDALADVPETPVMIYPNIDPGFETLIAMLEAFQERRPDIVLARSFSRQVFYSLMEHASFMIGNSSSGLWEAPSFELPAINVGLRQAGRMRAANVIDVSGLDRAELHAALQKARDPKFRSQLSGITNPYGSGYATALTLDVLKTAQLDDTLRMKRFHEIEFDPMAFNIRSTL